MSLIFIECLFLSACLIFLMGINPFVKKWKNLVLYACGGFFLTLIVSYVFLCFFEVQLSFYLIAVFSLFFVAKYLLNESGVEKAKPRKDEDTFILGSESGQLEFYYPRDNFMVLGGAGSGKTASIGKPILEQYIRYGWAGFIYDYKDYDYTKTAWNLVQKYKYPYKFYYISFTDMSRTYRFNILNKNVIRNETMLFQAMTDFFNAMKPEKGNTDEWFQAALGLLCGVAVRFYKFQGDYEKYCTLPHILNFILMATPEQLTRFLEGDMMSKMKAGAFLGSKGSERTQGSVIFSINNYISNLATNKNVCYVLSGNDFIYDLIDPEDPKLFAVSNNFAIESMISPIVAMLVPLAARRIEFGNRVKFAFVLDEMTTVKVNDFQSLPSVLREYGVSFLVLTQSGTKFDKLYGKEDRVSIMANFANLFLGKTKDVEALKYYPLFFGKEEKEKKSISAGSSSGRYNSSVTRSKQKEEIYDSNKFAELQKGEFILSAGESNVSRIKTRFEKFSLDEKPLPIVKLTTDREVEQNYRQIGIDCEKLLNELCPLQ